MYNIREASYSDAEPWLIPLEKRCAILEEAKRNGKGVALLLYEAPDTSTFRYRAYNVFKATHSSKLWASVYFYLNELDKVLSLLDKVDLLVIIRVRWSHSVDQVIYRAKAKGIKVLFDVDDLIFDLNHLNMVTNTLNVNFGGERDYEFWFALISRIGFTASKADGFISTNHELGRMLTEKYSRPYGIIPNSLNEEQLLASRACLAAKESKKSKPPFTIGYFSGTPSHINDFKVVYKELMQLLHEFDDINLSVVGFMDFPEEMGPLMRKGRITFNPLVNFIELQRLIAQVDVNIVPLVNNLFTNCKSELKFFESAIVKTLTVATPTYSYREAIDDGINGFLCQQGQWYDTIRKIYNNEVDYNKIVDAAYEYSTEHYYGPIIVQQIEECYDQFARR